MTAHGCDNYGPGGLCSYCTHERATRLHSTDAQTWAEEWMALVKANPHLAFDKGFMVGWFANAIEAGRDAGHHPINIVECPDQ